MIAFEKWEGLGNDFIVVEASALGAEASVAVVQRLCDRRFGVGADGVLVVDRDRPRMIVRNADGSRPEMCGNGLRCVAGYLLDSADGELAITTDAGELACKVARAGEGAVEAEIAMGQARFEAELQVMYDGRVHAFARVNMGNPHAVTFEPYAEAAIDAFAPIVEHAVEGATNVEFVQSEGDELVVRVWERGVGYTLACGTGACAVAAEACRRGHARYGAWTTVRLPGGPLAVLVEPSHEVRLRGPARRVFRGTTTLA